MKTVEIKVYSYDGLSEAAKEKAREWYSDCDSDWQFEWECVCGDAKKVGLNIESLGDARRDCRGAFTEDALEVAKKIMQGHGKDCATFKTADAYTAKVEELDKKFPLYGQDDSPYDFECEQEKEGLDDDFLGELLSDYYGMMVDSAEEARSRERVEENIRANDYQFTEDGKIYRG
jgi:hypothetical protein